MFIEKIKRIRKEKGINQDQLAAMLGMASSSYRRYEDGRASPTLELLTRIAQALDVTPCDLIASDNDNAHALIHYFDQLTQQDQDYFFTKIKALALDNERP